MAVSDADILAYVQANINDPGAIAAAAAQYGVSLDDLSRATGYSAPEVSNYFQQANIDTSNLVAQPAPAPEIDYAAQQREDSYAPVSQPVAPTPLPEPQSYTQPEPPAPPEPPAYVAPPVYTPPPQVLPEPTYNYAGGRGTVREDTQTFNDVDDFGRYDYYSQPQTATPATPPPAPTPQALSLPPPEPPAPVAPPRPIAPDIMTPLTPPPAAPAPIAPVAPGIDYAAQQREDSYAPTSAPVSTGAPAQPTAGRLTDQILAQGTTSKWTGEGFGSPEKNAADMAKILESVGITDISQFGKITKEEPTYSYDENGNQFQTGTVKVETFGNKLTGQAVGNTYGERQTGDAFGGTYAGSGNTGYRVQFDDKGNPYFYTSYQTSSDAGSWMPIVQLALAATGAGGLLGNALLGAGAGAVATNALGNAIISGALTGATGGDALKGALLGGVGGAIGGYLQGTPTTGGNSIFGGAIDGSTINFADLADTDVIDALKSRGLSNIQITDFLENSGGITVPSSVLDGSTVNFGDLADNSIIDALKDRGLTNVQINDFLNNAGGTVTGPAVPTSTTPIETVNVTGAATAPVVPTMVDPNILAAVTTQLNTNVKTPVPEVKITGDKTTKTDDSTMPTVTVTGDKPVTPVVPTVTVTGDKPVKTDETVPTVEVVGDKPVKPVVPTIEVVGDKPVTPVVPTVEVVAPKPPVVPPVVPPVIPEIVITPPPQPPVPPVVTPPTVVVPPVVLPPPPPPPPPVVVPPPVVTPPQTNGVGLNPGLIETTPFYNTTNDAQARYYYGDHGFQTGPAFDAASYNAVAAPDTPFGIQGVARPLNAADYENIILGKPFTPEQFTPATRRQAYNPALLQTPVGQSGSAQPVTGPVAPSTTYTMNPAEIQQISSVLGPAMAQALAAAMAAGDMATVNNIKSQYDYAVLQQQNQGGNP